MAATIRHKRSAVSGNVPASLAPGEIAINEADGIFYWRNSAGQIKSFSLCGGVPPNTGTAMLDFGAAGSSDTRVDVTGQTNIAASARPIVRVAYLDSPDHSADEHLAEDFNVYAGAVIAGVGFLIYGVTRNVALFGRWNVAWSY
jgi:hypothetical protein